MLGSFLSHSNKNVIGANKHNLRKALGINFEEENGEYQPHQGGE